MNILIHTCCADCLLSSIGNSFKEYSNIILYFYNPNIHPKTEYFERLKALKLAIVRYDLKNVKLIIPDYKPKEYFTYVKPLKNRCSKCWELRLRESFDYAKKNNISAVTTTLLTSHFQDKEKITEIGNRLQEEYNIKFVDLKNTKQEKHLGFYKQNYCGCCYSLVEKMDEKYSAN